jgi:methylmalonyl-CoA/ethylmalonyl-CoA epimerase
MPKLHHVGIIVPKSDQVEALLDLLQLERGETQYVPEYQADCIFTRSNGAVIEFIVPRCGKLSQFNRGMGGLHHIAIEVDNIRKITSRLKERKVRLLEDEAVDAGKMLINFLPPIYTRGIIVEFIQEKKDRPT